ncbi:Ca2+ binding protein, contains EF-hand motif (ISS) [Strigomonas culicis]|nr:Ca2+ binding protein, contains EF-hand motif (ISS) [Strigomonas culicis]|eukprot:EPY24894.1 Ca2+ binding protein, contains EF-hand motif (ISS) [Strigomonas culicis]
MWATASVALCRPLDTPAYLIPYYLRDVRSRFEHYASVQKRKGGPKYMTVDDFVRALLGSPDPQLKSSSAADGLREIFVKMDTNEDSFISFPEFRFLMALLTSKSSDVKLLFNIVDTDHTGAISLEQFADVLRGCTDDKALVRSITKDTRRKSGVLHNLFGTRERPRCCTFQEVDELIHSIRMEVWKAEFRQYDEDRNDRITAEQFSELIASQVLGSHLPYFLVNNIRKLRGDTNTISLDMWIGFHEVLLHAEELGEAIELYAASGLPVTRQGFQRAVRVTGIPPLPDDTINVLFSVFDKNNDGTMEMEEFLSIMKKKMSYHYQAKPRERVSLPTRFAQCTKMVVDEL